MIKVNNINNNNVNGISMKGAKVLDNAKLIANNLKALLNDAERAVPEYGDFGITKYVFKNTDKNINAGEVILSVKPSFRLKEHPKEREFEILVNSADDRFNYSATFKRGEKNDILGFLQSEGLAPEIEEFMKEASLKFSDMR